MSKIKQKVHPIAKKHGYKSNEDFYKDYPTKEAYDKAHAPQMGEGGPVRGKRGNMTQTYPAPEDGGGATIYHPDYGYQSLPKDLAEKLIQNNIYQPTLDQMPRPAVDSWTPKIPVGMDSTVIRKKMADGGPVSPLSVQDKNNWNAFHSNLARTNPDYGTDKMNHAAMQDPIKQWNAANPGQAINRPVQDYQQEFDTTPLGRSKIDNYGSATNQNVGQLTGASSFRSYQAVHLDAKGNVISDNSYGTDKNAWMAQNAKIQSGQDFAPPVQKPWISNDQGIPMDAPQPAQTAAPVAYTAKPQSANSHTDESTDYSIDAAREDEQLAKGGWIKKAVNPKHKGYFGDGGKTWSENQPPSIATNNNPQGISAPPIPQFESRDLVPTPAPMSDYDKQVRAIQMKDANTTPIGAKPTWQQKAHYYIDKGTQNIPGGDVVKAAVNMFNYPAHALVNLTQPSSYFKDNDNDQGNFVGAGNMMMDAYSIMPLIDASTAANRSLSNRMGQYIADNHPELANHITSKILGIPNKTQAIAKYFDRSPLGIVDDIGTPQKLSKDEMSKIISQFQNASDKARDRLIQQPTGKLVTDNNFKSEDYRDAMKDYSTQQSKAHEEHEQYSNDIQDGEGWKYPNGAPENKGVELKGAYLQQYKPNNVYTDIDRNIMNAFNNSTDKAIVDNPSSIARDAMQNEYKNFKNIPKQDIRGIKDILPKNADGGYIHGGEYDISDEEIARLKKMGYKFDML